MSPEGWVSVIGLVVTTLGFGLTIWQVWRTANAAEATKDAIENSSQRMYANYLLVLLPEFKAFELELDEAMNTNDIRMARRTLVQYSHHAQRAAALLSNSDDAAERDLATLLRESSTTATKVKSRLMTDTSTTVSEAAKPLVEEVSDVASKANGLVASYQLKVA